MQIFSGTRLMPTKILCIATVSISLFLKDKVFVLTGFVILISKMMKVIEKYTLNVLMIFLILEPLTQV